MKGMEKMGASLDQLCGNSYHRSFSFLMQQKRMWRLQKKKGQLHGGGKEEG